jgi:hypothetical protein
MKAVGLDDWKRFVSGAQTRAHDKATLAAIQKSRQPVIPVSATVGGAGSGSAGSGTKLAQADEPEDSPLEGANPPSMQRLKQLMSPLHLLEPELPEAERPPGPPIARIPVPIIPGGPPPAAPAEAPDTTPLRVIIEPDGLTIVTGFPINLPRNPKGNEYVRL